VGDNRDPILGARHVGIQPQTVGMPHCKTAHLKYQMHRCTKIYTMVDLQSLNFGNAEAYEKRLSKTFTNTKTKLSS